VRNEGNMVGLEVRACIRNDGRLIGGGV
jgi:hypothetical protein